ncbi:hypothetical protein F511_17006 [Dorcoceras hygrometricum]|uniref:Uncharacterized protein n=1 Tax=Dorcoceras hygrometricum TaxID=472368 RepID=A0A2Z7BJK6_9LAMI|nr:hypothetical protein F511_17006 [Dorcoceras hygrometricum]
MRSVVANHGPGSNPRGPKISKFQNRPKRVRYRIPARKLHGLPGTGPKKTLEEVSRHEIAGASPERRPAAAPPPRKISRRQRTTPRQALRTVARNNAPQQRGACATSAQEAVNQHATVRLPVRENLQFTAARRTKQRPTLRPRRPTSAHASRRSRASSARPAAIHRAVVSRMMRDITTLLATRAWLRPVSRGNRYFTVDCGRQRQSGTRPETGFLRQPALEGLTRSARMDSPRKIGRNNFRRTAAAAASFERREAAVFGSRLGLRDAGIDQLNFRSVQLDYLMLLQMGNTDPNKTKAENKYEVKPQYEVLSKQLGGRHSYPVVTALTIALDFSDTTQQSASPNVAPNQQKHAEDSKRYLLIATTTSADCS